MLGSSNFSELFHRLWLLRIHASFHNVLQHPQINQSECTEMDLSKHCVHPKWIDLTPTKSHGKVNINCDNLVERASLCKRLLCPTSWCLPGCLIFVRFTTILWQTKNLICDFSFLFPWEDSGTMFFLCCFCLPNDSSNGGNIFIYIIGVWTGKALYTREPVMIPGRGLVKWTP